MKSSHDWRQVRRFSLRKLTIGLVSATIGLAIIGGASPDQIALANQTQAQAQQGQTSVTYDYVHYEDLTTEQLAVLRDSKDFPKEIAKKGTNYLLVYRQDKGLLTLPKTSDQSGLYALLSGLGIFAVLLAVTKRNKKISTKVLIVTAISGAALTTANSQALEAGLRAFLTETHLVNLGQTLPQPQDRIGDRTFVYYLPQISGEQASPAEQANPEQPATSDQSTEPMAPSLPETPSQPTQPEHPVEPSQSEQPTLPAEPSQPDQPTLPIKPSQPDQPTLPTEPSQPEQPALPVEPSEPTTPIVEPVVTESVVSLPFMTDYREDPSLPLGTEVLIQAGVAGQKRLVFTDGVLTSEEVLSEPQNEIIARGSYVEPPVVTAPEEPTAPSQPEQPTPTDPTAPVEPTNPTLPLEPTPTEPVVETSVVDEVIPFNTETLDAPDLPIGKTQVVQVGQVGRRQVTYINGVAVSSQIIQLPINEIIRVGSRQEPEQPTLPTEPSQPEQPTLPTQPEQPTLPTEPTKPEQPTLPTEPTKPEQPTLPTEPTKPEEPTLPTEPTKPEEPTLPTEPTKPEQPTLPTEPTKPEEPTLPTEPTKPEQPTLPTEPTKPEEPTLPTEPTKPEEPTLPTEPTKPEEPTLPTKPTKPEQPTLPTEPTKPEQPPLPTEPSQPEQPTLPTESTQPEKPTLPTEPSQPEQPTLPTEPTKPEEPTLPTEPTKPEEPTLPTEPTKPEQPTLPTEPTKPEEPTLPTEPTKPEQPTLPTEPTQSEEPTLPTEPSQPEEPTLPTEPSQPEEPTLPTEPSQPEQPTLPTEPTKPEQPTLPTEPSQPDKPTLPTVPRVVKQTVKLNQPVLAENSIDHTSIPTDARVTWAENGQPSTSKLGTDIQGSVLITYADQSSETVPVTIDVTATQAELTEPKPVKQTVKLNQPVLAENSIDRTSIPTDARVTWAENGQPSTSKPGTDIQGSVLITYADQSSETVPVTIDVTTTQAELTEPKPVKQTVKLNQPILAENSIDRTSIPTDARVTWAENGQPSTSKPGTDIQGSVLITYADQSSETVPVTIDVTATQADTGNPEAIRQTVKRNATLEARDSIRQDSADNMAEFAWKNGQPDTSQANENLQAIVTVTYADGSTDDITVPITVQPWQADTGNPQPIRQTVKRNETLEARDSIRQDSAENMTGFEWKNGQPDTSQANDNLQAVVTVTYQDGSTDDITVPITVQPWQADTENPQAIRQTVKRNTTLEARDSIDQESAEKMTGFAWKNGQPDTSQANENLEAVVTVTYADGSTDDITVPITVQPWQADTGNPQALRQTVKRNAALEARDSIDQASAEHMIGFAWKNGQLDTSQANENLEAIVTVTYADGSSDDITVPITIQPWQADTGNPQAIRQTVKRNATLEARDSIKPDSAENMTEFSWKNEQPDTSQANENLQAIVTVTYADGSTDDITVPITVQPWQADTGNPQAIRQTVKRNATLEARDSIRPDSAENMTEFTWKNGQPDTSQANENLEAVVTVTYQDGSTEDITVPITVQPWQADTGNPQAIRQTVKRNTTLEARDSIRQDSAENMAEFTWKNGQPDTSQANENLKAVVTVTYQDGSSEDITVPITVQPWQADTGNPQSIRQTVKRNAALEARDSIRQDSADNMAEFAWKNGQPDTSQANDNLEVIVTVTYADGSTDDITVPITVQPWQADTGNPQAIRQTVKRNATLEARNSIKPDSAENMAEFTWKNGQPDTSQANENLEAIVTVTYSDGSTDDITVPITIQPWQADTGNPQGIRQTVKRNTTLQAQDSIRQDSAEKMAEFAWKNGQPDTSQVNDNLEAVVTVTYADGSTDDITVQITVQPWQADTGNPQAIRQTVKRNATLEARDSIRQDSAENMAEFAWKNGQPDTSQANDNLEAVVTVTYQDGSTDDITVPITIQPWQADTGNPQAVRQTVKRNAALEARDSIKPDSAENMTEFAWKNGQPDTSQANDNLQAVVTVTYQDGSTEDITVPITVQPWQADTGNPQAIRQTVKRNATLDARDSIKPDSAENMTGFAWKNGQPDTSQANENLEAIVIVTYQDGSTDDITVPITIQPWQADLTEPTPIVQHLKVGDVPVASASILQENLPEGTLLTWAENGTPSTEHVGDAIEGRVRVAYKDGSTDTVTVHIKVTARETIAQQTNPEALTQRVAVGTTGLAPAASVKPSSVDRVKTTEWLTQPSTEQAGLAKVGKVRITYEDNSHDDLDVQVDVVTKPTLSLTKLAENDEAQTASLTYRLENPSSTYTSAKVRLLKGSEVIREVDLEQWQSAEQSLLLDNLEHNIEYTVETVLTYNLGLGQGPQTETLTDRRKVELLIKKVEFRNVLDNELYTVDDAGQLTRVNGLTTAPSQADLANYVVKIRTSKNKDVYLPVSSITDSGDGFTVTASHPELVQFAGDNTSKTDGHSFTLTKIVASQNAYSDFTSLIQAITNNPAGDYFLAADMDATASTGTPYITVPFTGKLASVAGNNRFAIKGLRGPLFSDLNGSVSNIALTGVNINNTSLKEVGALAKNANNASISDVEVQGSLIVNSYVGGLVYKTTGTTAINHVTTDVTISTQFSGASHPMGGIIGLQQAGSLTNSKSTVNMRARLTPGGLPVGGLVGEVHGTVSNSSTSGTISVTRTTAYAGGAFGNFRGTADNVISAVTVTNGNGFTGFQTPFSQVTNSATVIGSTGQGGIPSISSEEATTRSANWGARPAATLASTETTAPTTNTVPAPTAFNWLSLSKAKADYVTAYENMEKLLPYYDRHTIVKYANKLTTDSKLYQTKLLSAVPMIGTDFITNTIGETGINRLFLHFADNSKEEHDLTTVGNFKETDIKEFSFGDGLLYTPEQFNQVPETLVNDLVAELRNIPELTKEDLISFLAIQDEGTVNKDNWANRLLYLKKPLEQVKANLTDHVKALISSYASIDLDSQALVRYLKQEVTKDKKRLMLALAHLERSYDVNYDAYNIKDLVTYRPDFDGKKVDLLSYLTGFAKDEPTLRMTNSFKTYADQIKGVSADSTDLISFLEHRRALFLPGKTNEEWFKTNTKAFIAEQGSTTNPTAPYVKLYDKLKQYTAANNLTGVAEKPYERFILPLLNLEKENEIFALSTMTTLSLGTFAQLVDPNLATSNPEQFAAEIERIKSQNIPTHLTAVGNFLDFWARMVPDKKEVLSNRQTLILQGYNVKNGTGKRWLTEHGDAYGIVDDFFGPIGWYYTYAAQSAFANQRDRVQYLGQDMLTDGGVITITHELTHNYDQEVILNNYGRRIGFAAEAYAKGLFETAPRQGNYFGFNSAMTNALGASNHNSTPQRFDSTTDLQTYMKGVMDVTYSLDLLELEAIGKQATSDHMRFFYKLELTNQRTSVQGGITYTHADDLIRELTTADWAAIDTLTVDKLIEQNLVMKDMTSMNGSYLGKPGQFGLGTAVRTDDNNYLWVSLTAPIYGGNVNEHGASGGLQFRRTAFELLAAKGWDALLAYTTNKLKAQAEAAGLPLSDQYILDQVLGKSYQDFKKEEYAARQAQLEQLKGITITYNGQTRAINSTADLRALFEEATRQDLDLINRNRPAQAQNRVLLKQAILKAYHQVTNDFRESIYKP